MRLKGLVFLATSPLWLCLLSDLRVSCDTLGFFSPRQLSYPYIHKVSDYLPALVLVHHRSDG